MISKSICKLLNHNNITKIVFLSFFFTFILLNPCISYCTQNNSLEYGNQIIVPVGNDFKQQSIRIEPNHAQNIDNHTELEVFIDNLINQQMEEIGVPGVIVSIVHNNMTLLSKGYGFMDINLGRIATNETLFRIGSISKLFTWTAVMQLWEQGKIDLHEDINTYLPDITIKSPISQSITMYHLLSHTAGFDETLVFGPVGNDEETLSNYCKTILPAFARSPGQTAAYSNYGVALAGYIVELVSGMRFEDYIEEFIFTPLNMDHSTFYSPGTPELISNLSRGYSRQNVDGIFIEQEFEYVKGAPAGSMLSTANDMTKFMIAHLNNGSYGSNKILNEDTALEMYTSSFTSSANLPGIAHGWFEFDWNGRKFLTHDGAMPFFSSDLGICHEEKFGLFISTNNPAGRELMFNLIAEVMDQYFLSTDDKNYQPLTGYKERVGEFAGSYISLRRVHTHSGKALLLTDPKPLLIKFSTTEDGFLVFDERRYLEVEPFIFRQVSGKHYMGTDDTVIVFKVDSSGNVNQVFVANSLLSYDKLNFLDNPSIHLNYLILLLLFIVVGLFFELGVIGKSFVEKMNKNNLTAEKSTEMNNTELSWREKIRYNSCKYMENAVIVRIFSMINSFLILIFFITISDTLYNFSHIMMKFSDEMPSILDYTFLLIPSVVLIISVALLSLVAVIWFKNYWAIKQRIYYSISSVIFILLLLELNYWNLLFPSIV